MGNDVVGDEDGVLVVGDDVVGVMLGKAVVDDSDGAPVKHVTVKVHFLKRSEHPPIPIP